MATAFDVMQGGGPNLISGGPVKLTALSPEP
jgi:hypothetical protein